ncbi:heterokaryon incompatibility protein-domain-containing protein, partial [Hyaloscypha sp. PMI_1271]
GARVLTLSPTISTRLSPHPTIPATRGGSSLLFWSDTVWINQDSIEERGSQVAIMGSIFENARRVFIYLGEEDFHSNLAMAYLSAIEKREIQFDTPTTPEVLEALTLFLARPWFSRIWVLQEVYQAKKAIL